MEDDVKNVSETSPVYSSLLLTDWLFKYKVDNISYLSSPQSFHAHTIKCSRKGGIFDSRDIIRPTVQLFKNIRVKNKKRNETPSPQRNKAKGITIPSPTRETNRIFNHKTGGDVALDNYKKIYTYARVKQDKVSRDKIESAVALYRQREHEKENTASKYPPEKNKRNAETKEVFSSIPKSRKSAKPCKPTVIEKSHKILSKSEEKQNKEFQEIKNHSVSRDNEKKTISGDSKKNEESEQNETNKRSKANSLNKITSKLKKNSRKGNSSEKDGKDNLTNEEGKNKDIKILYDDKTINKLNIDKELLRSKSITNMKKINSDNENEKGQINVINFVKDLEIESSRASLIRSLKSQHSHREVNKSDAFQNTTSIPQLNKSRGEVLNNRKLITADYIIIKPAFAGTNTINVQNGLEPKAKKSVDDLLREYRIKYRNMIKLR